jgi:diadenosine tetraphosphate (Ap4A) HIT family hydrolase
MLKGLVAADKINVAALGNVVAQLHVHVIARFAADPAWPAPVWGRAPPQAYADADARAMLARTRAALGALASAAAEAPGAGGDDQAAAASWRPHAD